MFLTMYKIKKMLNNYIIEIDEEKPNRVTNYSDVFPTIIHQFHFSRN